jgi:TPR repeat protein
MTTKGAKMKKLLVTLLTVLMLNAAWAGPEDEALAAWVRKDYAAVLKIVRPSALKGEPWAQGWLGDVYVQGLGVVQDYAEAVKWYWLAALQGDALAQNQLGVSFASGRGVLQDYAEAVRWYRLAAQQGADQAQSNLGAMYADGNGVVQDYVKAHSWFNLAAVNGNASATKNRDIVAKRMTPQQIAEAQKLARDCQARQFKGCD